MNLYKVTTKVVGLGLNVTEIKAESLLEAQTKILADWQIKIQTLLGNKDFSQFVFDIGRENVQMTMLDKWQITIVENLERNELI